MLMTFDLTERQASRVLEQALRTGAELEIEPRNGNTEGSLAGQLKTREGRLLGVRIAPRTGNRPLTELMGVFCDVRIVLMGNQYVFTSCVVDTSDSEATLLYFSAPDTIHVSNRRAFERTNVHVASQVRLCPAGQSVATVGLLTNISPTGLACTMPGLELEETLFVGDRLRIIFELAGAAGNFNLAAEVCDKRTRREKQQLELGLEFRIEAEDQVGQQTLGRLRKFLAQLFIDFTRTDGDA